MYPLPTAPVRPPLSAPGRAWEGLPASLKPTPSSEDQPRVALSKSRVSSAWPACSAGCCVGEDQVGAPTHRAEAAMVDGFLHIRRGEPAQRLAEAGPSASQRAYERRGGIAGDGELRIAIPLDGSPPSSPMIAASALPIEWKART